MISASNDTQQQEALIEKYMQLPNQVWDDIINQAAKNVDVLKDHEAVKQLGSILKTNVRACKALGHPYVMQLGRIYLDMLNVYKVMSENISTAIRYAFLINFLPKYRCNIVMTILFEVLPKSMNYNRDVILKSYLHFTNSKLSSIGSFNQVHICFSA